MARKSTTPKKKVSKTVEKVINNINNPFVRQEWADYADKKLIPKYQVCRFDDRLDNRFYYFHHKGELIIASGITEPFGYVSTEREAINKWKEANPNWRHLLNVSSDYGTLEHRLQGNISLNQGVSKELLRSMIKIAQENGKSADMPIKDTLAYLAFNETYKVRPLLIEAQLAWQDPVSGEWLAMTIDMLAEMDVIEKTKETVEDGMWQRGEKKGQPKIIEVTKETTKTITVVVDFKSNFFEKEKKSFYETHKLQLIGGMLAVEQNFGIKVDRLYNYAPNSWRTAPSFTLFEHKIDDDDIGLWFDYWRLIIRKKLNRPKGNFIISNEFKNSTDYKMLDYREYVEQVLLKDTNIDYTTTTLSEA